MFQTSNNLAFFSFLLCLSIYHVVFQDTAHLAHGTIEYIVATCKQ